MKISNIYSLQVSIYKTLSKKSEFSLVTSKGCKHYILSAGQIAIYGTREFALIKLVSSATPASMFGTHVIPRLVVNVMKHLQGNYCGEEQISFTHLLGRELGNHSTLEALF